MKPAVPDNDKEFYRHVHPPRSAQGSDVFSHRCRAVRPKVTGHRARRRLGSVGACTGTGTGIGSIFKGVIESVTRQPEVRAEITDVQWLGFALTEAVFFYGLVAGLIAYIF